MPVLHILGNHCFYNLTRPALNDRLGIHAWTADVTSPTAVPLLGQCNATTRAHSYYSVCPAPGWRVVVVDAYDVSMLGWGDDHPHYALAAEILDRENSNDEKNSPEGMTGIQRRFVKFGGGVGSVQLQWLDAQLTEAHSAGERVIVAGHLPFHPDTAPRTVYACHLAAQPPHHTRSGVLDLEFSRGAGGAARASQRGDDARWACTP